MNKYSNGKIYKIVDNTNGDVYYGSTIQPLHKRLLQHNLKNCTSRTIISNGDYNIELVETYPCKSRKELQYREGQYILDNECINLSTPGRTPMEYYNANKEQIRLQRIEYRQRTKEQSKEYDRRRRLYKKSWGDPRYHNCMLSIDIDLFE